MAEQSTMESIWEALKKMLPGGIFTLFDKVIGSFTGMFGGIFSLLAEPLGLTDKVNELKETVSGFKDTIISKFDQDLTTARTGTATAIDGFFADNSAKLGLEGNILTKITADTKAVADGFYSQGIPALDEGRPVAAYSTAVKYRKQLVDYLVGDGESTLGALSPDVKNREKVAEQIATTITGIPADATLATIAANPPKSGLAATLANVQTTLGSEGFEKDSLQAGSITMGMDNTAKAQAAAKNAVASTNTVSGAADVEKPAAPKATPKPYTPGQALNF